MNQSSLTPAEASPQDKEKEFLKAAWEHKDSRASALLLDVVLQAKEGWGQESSRTLAYAKIAAELLPKLPPSSEVPELQHVAHLPITRGALWRMLLNGIFNCKCEGYQQRELTKALLAKQELSQQEQKNLGDTARAFFETMEDRSWDMIALLRVAGSMDSESLELIVVRSCLHAVARYGDMYLIKRVCSYL